MVVVVLTSLFYGLPIYKFYAYPTLRDIVSQNEIPASTQRTGPRITADSFVAVLEGLKKPSSIKCDKTSQPNTVQPPIEERDVNLE